MANEMLRSVDIKVQKKSGFDKSHQNLLTSKVGTITPILCDEVIPNTSVNLKLNLSATLPPLASDTFMRCQVKAEAFFVPTRILCGDYEDWLTTGKINSTGSSIYLPTAAITTGTTSAVTGAGTLLDYLGFKALSADTTGEISMLPMLGYHKIWDDWYRQPLVQNSCFAKIYVGMASPTAEMKRVRNALSSVYTASTATDFELKGSNSNLTLNDGKQVYSLRQRNFGADYFTTSTPKAQNGDPQSVSFVVPVSGDSAGNGSFTISALRAANSMQQFLERNNIAGNRMVDFVRAHYGADLSSGVAQRSVLLGSAAFDIYTKGIYQTANISGNTNNPFDGSVGAEFGSAYASGSDFIINGFTANEPGYIYVMVSLVPKVTYGTGIRRYLLHYCGLGSQTDMATPLLQNVGNQPIYRAELNGNPSDTGVYGYTDRYAEFKTFEDELHGLVRDGQSLASFALQKTYPTYANAISITTQGLEIPTTYLDQVTAVNGSVSNYGVWIDSYLDYKVSMPLAQYSIPSLQDPAYEHGVDIKMQRGGTSLR